MSDEKIMISSKDILLKTNISRATLNNYIRMGILPKPIVQEPLDGIKGPRKIGYFPAHSLDRIEKIRNLKKEGFSMKAIAEKMKQTELDRPSLNYIGTRRAIKKRNEILATPTLFPEMESSDPFSMTEKTIKEIPHPSGHNLPSLLPFCVLHAVMENSKLLSDEMPPEEYCALIEKIFEEFEAICVKNDGFCQYGYLFSAIFISDGKTSYLRNALKAGIEVRSLSRRIESSLTNGRSSPKNIQLNVGLGFGEEYCAMVKGSPGWIITATDFANKEARILSKFARGGTLWVSKNILCRLSIGERRNYRFGVRQGEGFFEQTFFRIKDLLTDSESDESLASENILAAEVIERLYGRKG
jgi:DNA-binding transcriptional MerR regulator